jgi:hypothetical protein
MKRGMRKEKKLRGKAGMRKDQAIIEVEKVN